MQNGSLRVQRHGTSFGITDGTRWAPIAYAQRNAAELVLARHATTLVVAHAAPQRVIDLSSL